MPVVLDREEEIRRIAYNLWQQDGCQQGRDWEYYFRAEKSYQQQQGQRSSSVQSESRTRAGARSQSSE
jgi:hypothetical protein